MQYDLYRRFAPVIRSLSPAELEGSPTALEKLTLERQGSLQVCYAPFEYINSQARLLIVGITPGRTQMVNAVREARRQIDLGATEDEVLRAAKLTAAFSGPMRESLVAMLDNVGVAHWLGTRTAAELFGSAAHLVQTTSALRNPVFVDGENYNGTPSPKRNALLLEQLRVGFVQDLREVPDAQILALGDKVAQMLELLVERGSLDPSRVLGTIPHPSGANAERIKYFLGQKPRTALSAKVDPDKLDQARSSVVARLAALS